jgi:hypothetical protein
MARGILYAPDYVINAGGIINVSTEYLKDGDASVRQRIEGIPTGWRRSGARARPAAAIPPRCRCDGPQADRTRLRQAPGSGTST